MLQESVLNATPCDPHASYAALVEALLAHCQAKASQPLWRLTGKKLSYKPFMDDSLLPAGFGAMMSCRTCGDLIRDYGSVAFLDAQGKPQPLLWTAVVPTEWQGLWAAMRAQCAGRRIRAPFPSRELREQNPQSWNAVLPSAEPGVLNAPERPLVLFGRPEAGGFHHMYIPLYQAQLWVQDYHVNELIEICDILSENYTHTVKMMVSEDQHIREVMRILSAEPGAEKFMGELRIWRGFIKAVSDNRVRAPEMDRRTAVWAVLPLYAAHLPLLRGFRNILAGELLEMVRQGKSEALVLQFFRRQTDSLRYKRTEKTTTTEGETERFRKFLDEEGYSLDALSARYLTRADYEEGAVGASLVRWTELVDHTPPTPVEVNPFDAMQGKAPVVQETHRTAPLVATPKRISARSFFETVLPKALAVRIKNRPVYMCFSLHHGTRDTKPILRYDHADARMPVAPITWKETFGLEEAVGVLPSEPYVYAELCTVMPWEHTGSDVCHLGQGYQLWFGCGATAPAEALCKNLTGGLFPATLRNEFHPHRRAAEIYAQHRKVVWEGDVLWGFTVGPNNLTQNVQAFDGEFWTEYQFGSWE